MNEHRWTIWRKQQREGRVRYRTAEFKCADCDHWHTVQGVRRYVHYDETHQTLEDMVLDALRTSGTHGCQHKSAKKPKTDASNGESKPI